MQPPAFPPTGPATVRAAPGTVAEIVLPPPSGTPPFHYKWTRAGASLDERFREAADGTGVRLTVSAAQTGDSGVYTLQASNAAGSDTTRVRLEVSADEAATGEDPPTFLRRLQDLTVKVGTRTRFLVEIISSTECKVTWYRNERRLLEAERVSLARDGNFWCADLAAVSVDDAGRWTCTAENVGGRASCSAHLNVLVPKAYKRPEFVEELRALLTEQGTVSLECKVVGVPTPLLRWFKDSCEIKAGDVFALTANAEDPTSLGTYTCEAVNCMGRAYSSSKVHVVGRGSREGTAKPTSSGMTPEPPPIFTKELEDQYVKVCEPLTLGCQVAVPPWPRSVVWYNKQGKVEPSERYHVLEDGAGGYVVELPSAEWPDEGEWKCVATSSTGRVGISTCYVTMDVPKNYRKPRFMENLQAVLTEEGLVSFECKVVGFPTPVLSWYKDGQELKPGDVYQLTGTNSLGSYCCIAKNCMGQASSSAELTVEDIQNQLNEEEKLQLFSKNQAPKFIQGLKSVEAKIDKPFRFTVKVAIPPEPSVLWYRDDQPVDESTRCHHGNEERGVFYLDIQSLEFLDQAEWKCVAMNDFGHSVTSCFLKLIIPRHYKKPRFLENLQAILSEEGAVNLECKVIGVPQPVLKWYKDGEELKPGDIHRIISGQDGTCCLGTYTCEAQNCMGIAASSASLLGFDDSMKAKKKKAEDQALQRNLSLSTIHEERTSQMYDTPVGDITLDDKGEISFSFDGKEVSVSLYETPDLTEEEALQIVEMYADQLSENITEHNVVELPPLRFVKETSTSGNLLMEAVIIDVSPEYFASPEEDLRTEADVEDLSIADENGPPQLSLDQDIGGEDHLDNTMAYLSEEKSDIPAKLDRKKSDSQRSADDFFSLSREQSLSEEKRDDDTQVISESDIPSFASAHSLGKLKSKSLKHSHEDGQEFSEPIKTTIFKDETSSVMKGSIELESEPLIVKPKRERKTSRSSRRSSSSSEKSLTKSKEEIVQPVEKGEIKNIKPKLTAGEFKEQMCNISTSLSKIINDVQIIERDIILKSELMSSAATASKSLEIISSLISPLSEVHSIADAAKETALESTEVSSSLFNSLPQPLKSLQQSLTIVEKCIDMESDSKTLVKKTCVAFIETCGNEIQKVLSEINSVTSKEYLITDNKVLNEIDSLTNEISTVIKFSSDTIKARSLLNEASEIQVEEPTLEAKHLSETQKAIFELKSPLHSLLYIAQCVDSGNIVNVGKVRYSEVILNDMSVSVQDLQTALQQIESLSVKEETSPLRKYNTEIIETVMDSVLKLRSSFEQLSIEAKTDEVLDDKIVLKQTVASIKENLNDISTYIDAIENKVGTFEILQSENKLDALQKMAQILIALENNLPRLETVPEIKSHMTVFHKNLTKVLESVIECNEAKKYFALMEICGAVNRINGYIKNLDTENVLPLASLGNTLRIVQNDFIKNFFESELNCSILTNIGDTLVAIQGAINIAEETSMHIDSEYIQEMPSLCYDESKVNVIVSHIDQTIAAIESVRVAESVRELKLDIAPILQNICPILENLKRSVASIKDSGLQDEHVSDMSEVSYAQTLATPLYELNQNIIVLNQQIVENMESLKESSEIIATIAEPLHELHTMLEILQQDVISQYGEDLNTYNVSVNMASAVQNLQSCIVMIEEQAGVEAAEEMSTLEDVSGIKTTAETIPSDHLVLPTAQVTASEQSVNPLDQEIHATVTAQALQTLNEHITVLQRPEIIDALDTLSEVSDYSSLKSFAVGLSELHSGIEEILHPVILERSNEIQPSIDSSKLTVIAEPMLELQQSLSILNICNIPLYENILELPTERIHSVIQNVSEFKEHLDKCMLAVYPAMETANNTVEIANKVGALREVCEHLKDVLESTQAIKDISDSEDIIALKTSIDSLLNATDISKGIKIEQVKSITEELFEKIVLVQEEMIQFTPQSSEKLTQEAKIIQTIEEIESNIATLEQYDFVDLSQTSDFNCVSPQIAGEIESQSFLQIEDMVENAVNIIHDSAMDTPIVDLMIVEDFFKMCKNEFTILRCLILKASSHKKIIRLLQEFNSLQGTIKDFKAKETQLNLSNDIKICLEKFFTHADECLKSVQTSLYKIVDSQSELLFKTPIAKLESTRAIINEISEIKQDVVLQEMVEKFVQLIDDAKPSIVNTQSDVINELKNFDTMYAKTEQHILIDRMEDFIAFVERAKVEAADVNIRKLLEKLSHCIEKHEDFRDASGTGKNLILLKCLSDITDILKEDILEVTIMKPKLEERSLKVVLTEMMEPLQALHNQLINIEEQILKGIDENCISVDITTTQSLIQTTTEKHKEIIQQTALEQAVVTKEVALIMEVDNEIHSIQDRLKSLENVQAAQMVKELVKPINDVENTLHSILPTENTCFNKLDKEKAHQLIMHIDKYIELIEIVEEISAVIKIEDIKETFDIAQELRENITALDVMSEEEESKTKAIESREKQTRLAQKLQKALTALQVHVMDSAQELAPALNGDIVQRIGKVTAQLQADLAAVTGIHIAIQAPVEQFTEKSDDISKIEKEAAAISTLEALQGVVTEPMIIQQIDAIVEPSTIVQASLVKEIAENSVAECKETIVHEAAHILAYESPKDIAQIGNVTRLNVELEKNYPILAEQVETVDKGVIIVESEQAFTVADTDTAAVKQDFEQLATEVMSAETKDKVVIIMEEETVPDIEGTDQVISLPNKAKLGDKDAMEIDSAGSQYHEPLITEIITCESKEVVGNDQNITLSSETNMVNKDAIELPKDFAQLEDLTILAEQVETIESIDKVEIIVGAEKALNVAVTDQVVVLANEPKLADKDATEISAAVSQEFDPLVTEVMSAETIEKIDMIMGKESVSSIVATDQVIALANKAKLEDKDPTAIGSAISQDHEPVAVEIISKESKEVEAIMIGIDKALSVDNNDQNVTKSSETKLENKDVIELSKDFAQLEDITILAEQIEQLKTVDKDNITMGAEKALGVTVIDQVVVLRSEAKLADKDATDFNAAVSQDFEQIATEVMSAETKAKVDIFMGEETVPNIVDTDQVIALANKAKLGDKDAMEIDSAGSQYHEPLVREIIPSESKEVVGTITETDKTLSVKSDDQNVTLSSDTNLENKDMTELRKDFAKLEDVTIMAEQVETIESVDKDEIIVSTEKALSVVVTDQVVVLGSEAKLADKDATAISSAVSKEFEPLASEIMSAETIEKVDIIMGEESVSSIVATDQVIALGNKAKLEYKDPTEIGSTISQDHEPLATEIISSESKEVDDTITGTEKSLSVEGNDQNITLSSETNMVNKNVIESTKDLSQLEDLTILAEQVETIEPVGKDETIVGAEKALSVAVTDQVVVLANEAKLAGKDATEICAAISQDLESLATEVISTETKDEVNIITGKENVSSIVVTDEVIAKAKLEEKDFMEIGSDGSQDHEPLAVEIISSELKEMVGSITAMEKSLSVGINDQNVASSTTTTKLEKLDVAELPNDCAQLVDVTSLADQVETIKTVKDETIVGAKKVTGQVVVLASEAKLEDKDATETSTAVSQDHMSVAIINIPEVVENINAVAEVENALSVAIAEQVVTLTSEVKLDDKDVTEISADISQNLDSVSVEIISGETNEMVDNEKILMAPKMAVHALIQHLEEYLAEDITETINELSHLVNVEELKQSVNIAKDFHEHITASEVKVKADIGETLMVKLNTQQVKLAQELQKAIIALDEVLLDSLKEHAANKKDIIQRIASASESIRDDLHIVIDKNESLFQIKYLGVENMEAIAAFKDINSEITEQSPTEKKEEGAQCAVLTSELMENVDTEPQSGTNKLIIAEIAVVETVESASDTINENIIMDLKLRKDDTNIEKEIVEKVPPSTETITAANTIQLPEVQSDGEKTVDVVDKAKTEQTGLIQHIDDFLSAEISEMVNEISVLIDTAELKETAAIAKRLKEGTIALNIATVEEVSPLSPEAQAEHMKLALNLQKALLTLHNTVLENVETISPIINLESLQTMSEVITHLQEDLESAVTMRFQEVLDDVHSTNVTEENSMKQLEALLEDVTDKINIPANRDAEDTEALQDTLDEVQTVIIKLKRDYDGVANDTLNETLEDLECSVRSVQLQINEDSPPELLQEACATLKLLVNNMTETQSVQIIGAVAAETNTENIIEKCSTETDETFKLLDLASKVGISDDNLDIIITTINNLKDSIKSLKLSFVSSADVLIEKGVDVIHNLNQLEDKVFMLEKDLAEANLRTEVRDSILTAIHSVYSSISNMRGTISSVQKRYMFENYGKPSELLLRSIKNILAISDIDVDNQQNWKKISKSLRKLLNHFEDIKFYINLDKTARLPSDAAFTKIILDDLKSNIAEIVIPVATILGIEATKKVQDVLSSVNKSLENIEIRPTLEVKEKIPIFKEIANEILAFTGIIKALIQKEINKQDKEHTLLNEQIATEKVTSLEVQTNASIATVKNTEAFAIENIDKGTMEDSTKVKQKGVKFEEPVIQDTIAVVNTINLVAHSSNITPSDFILEKQSNEDMENLEKEVKILAVEILNDITSEALNRVEMLAALFGQRSSDVESVSEELENSQVDNTCDLVENTLLAVNAITEGRYQEENVVIAQDAETVTTTSTLETVSDSLEDMKNIRFVGTELEKSESPKKTDPEDERQNDEQKIEQVIEKAIDTIAEEKEEEPSVSIIKIAENEIFKKAEDTTQSILGEGETNEGVQIKSVSDINIPEMDKEAATALLNKDIENKKIVKDSDHDKSLKEEELPVTVIDKNTEQTDTPLVQQKGQSELKENIVIEHKTSKEEQVVKLQEIYPGNDKTDEYFDKDENTDKQAETQKQVSKKFEKEMEVSVVSEENQIIDKKDFDENKIMFLQEDIMFTKDAQYAAKLADIAPVDNNLLREGDSQQENLSIVDTKVMPEAEAKSDVKFSHELDKPQKEQDQHEFAQGQKETSRNQETKNDKEELKVKPKKKVKEKQNTEDLGNISNNALQDLITKVEIDDTYVKEEDKQSQLKKEDSKQEVTILRDELTSNVQQEQEKLEAELYQQEAVTSGLAEQKAKEENENRDQNVQSIIERRQEIGTDRDKTKTEKGEQEFRTTVDKEGNYIEKEHNIVEIIKVDEETKEKLEVKVKKDTDIVKAKNEKADPVIVKKECDVTVNIEKKCETNIDSDEKEDTFKKKERGEKKSRANKEKDVKITVPLGEEQHTTSNIKKEEMEPETNIEKSENVTTTKEDNETEAIARIVKEEKETKNIKEREAKCKDDKYKQDTVSRNEAKANKEKDEQAAAKKDEEGQEATIVKDIQETTHKKVTQEKAGKTNKETGKIKKEKQESEAKKDICEQDANIKEQNDETEAITTKVKDTQKVKSTREKDAQKAKVIKEEEKQEAKTIKEVTALTKEDKKETEAKKEIEIEANKSNEQETVTRKEQGSKAKKEAVENATTKENEEQEAKVRKEQDGQQDSAMKSKKEQESKSNKDKDKQQLEVKKEREDQEITTKNEKETKPIKDKDVLEVKNKETLIEKVMEEKESYVIRKKDEQKVQVEQEKEEQLDNNTKKGEDQESKPKKDEEEQEPKAKKDKEEREALAGKEIEKKEPKAKKKKDEQEANAKKLKEETEFNTKKEKDELETKAKKENQVKEVKAEQVKQEDAKKIKQKTEAQANEEEVEHVAETLNKEGNNEFQATAVNGKEKKVAKLKKEKYEQRRKNSNEIEKHDVKIKVGNDKLETEVPNKDIVIKENKKEAEAKEGKDKLEAEANKELEKEISTATEEKDTLRGNSKIEVLGHKEKEETDPKVNKAIDGLQTKRKKEKEEEEAKATEKAVTGEAKVQQEDIAKKEEADLQGDTEDKKIKEAKAKEYGDKQDVKKKKEDTDAQVKEVKHQTEAKTKEDIDELEATAKKDKEEQEVKAKEEGNQQETKAKKEDITKKVKKTETMANKEKEELEAKKDDDEKETKAKENTVKQDTITKNEKEETEAKRDKNDLDTRGKNEQIAEAKEYKEEVEKQKDKKKANEKKKVKDEQEPKRSEKKKEHEGKAKKGKEELKEANMETTNKNQKEELKVKAKNGKDNSDESEVKTKKDEEKQKLEDKQDANDKKIKTIATKEKDKIEIKAKKEKDEQVQANIEKDAEVNEDERSQKIMGKKGAMAKKEQEEREAKAKEDKEEKEARAENKRYEGEEKAKKDKEAEATKEIHGIEAKAKKETITTEEKEENEAQSKKEENDQYIRPKKEKEEQEAISKKDKYDQNAVAPKNEKEAKVKKKNDEQQANTIKGIIPKNKIEENDTNRKKEKGEMEHKAKKEKGEQEAKLTHQQDEEKRSRKEKEEEGAISIKKNDENIAHVEKKDVNKKEKREVEAKLDDRITNAMTEQQDRNDNGKEVSKKHKTEKNDKEFELKRTKVDKFNKTEQDATKQTDKKDNDTTFAKDITKEERAFQSTETTSVTGKILDLNSNLQSPTPSKLSTEENGPVAVDETDDHYIKEYQYEPSRRQDRPKFVDHNHRDYTMEFMRPPGYRERIFDDKPLERETLGKNTTIYKTQTLVLDSQLRSSLPPQRDRVDTDRRVERHRSKALSEARSLVSEKRGGMSRDSKRKPVFSTYLTDRTAVEGSRVKLTCSVLSSSDPNITWYRNGLVLDNKLKYKTRMIEGLITLEVLNAVPSDSAEYSCTVENENGSVSTSANLKVYPSFEASPIPPTFTRSIRDNYHLAENELILECRIRGQPLPTITWFKDDKPVSTNERYQAFYLADGVCRLAITSPTPEDSGKYTCKAENSVWSDQITHVVNFTGKESRLSPNLTTIERSRFNRQAMESRRPHFTNVLSDYKVAHGGTIGLQVEIKGSPTRVEWLREGCSVTEIYRNARTFVEQGLYTLALSDVTEKESGLYTCRAWGNHGNVDMNAAITVVQPTEMEGKPAMIVGRPEKDILISVGEDINISFRVQGEPKPKVVFMKGIRDITTSQRVCKMTSDDYVKFTVKRSVVSDAGTYCVLARNAYGCDRAFVTVVVRQRASSESLISDWTYPLDDSVLSVAERKYKSVPDRIPGEPNVVDGGSNWVSLAWPKPDPQNGAPVLAYKIESWLIGKDGGARWTELGITPLNSFDAFNLKQGEEYHFRVTPRNKYGWGEAVQTSTPVGIGLAGDGPGFIEILPGQLKVLAGETANLNCTVKGKPLPEVVWMKNGHEVEEDSRMTTLFNGYDCCLIIKDLNVEDEGRYSCEARNVHGRASTYARLAVVTDRSIWEADAKLKRERSADVEGDYSPQFTMRLRDRRVQATYPVRLTCQVIGNPPPSVTWYKDGEEISFDTRRSKYQDEQFHTLEIAPTTLEDGGVYEAMARNSSGAVSCRCSLVVDKGIRAYVAPEFCCGLEPLYRLAEGDELRISAVVEAYPSVGVTWYRNGVRLRPSRRAVMTLDRDGQIELAIAAIAAREAGVYTCTASNEVGRASTSGKVEVIEGERREEVKMPPVVINAPDVPYSKEPMFIRKPRSSEACEGDTVIIACEVVGDPKPDVYWLRDFLKPDYYRDATHFKRVGDGPEYRFEIPHAKLDYTGAYSVVARNVHGEAKAIISLQILAKDPSSSVDAHNVRYGRVEIIPRFERELTDLLSCDGDAVEFECRVTGNPEPDVRWFHYHKLIRDCPDFESTYEEGTARLKIKQVTAEDEGTYSCEAANSLGKATTSACLVVYPPGEPNTLSQRLRRPPALLSGASTPRSTPRSTPARSMSRTPGPDPRRLCSPSRQTPPSFYTYPFNKVVEEGDRVVFQCAVKGLPVPWATWDKDGVIITPSARFTFREKDEMLRILEIEDVTIEDVGIYRITLENEFGRAEASARLEVITQKGKFYGGLRAYSPSPRRSLAYRRAPSTSRQD